MNHNTVIGKRNALNNWLRQFTVIIDPEKKLYKIQESLLGVFKWGHFKKLPSLDYVLVFRSFYAKCEQCSLDEENDFSYYQVSLMYAERRRIIIHESKKYSEARMMAENLSKALYLKVVDRFKHINGSKQSI